MKKFSLSLLDKFGKSFILHLYFHLPASEWESWAGLTLRRSGEVRFRSEASVSSLELLFRKDRPSSSRSPLQAPDGHSCTLIDGTVIGNLLVLRLSDWYCGMILNAFGMLIGKVGEIVTLGGARGFRFFTLTWSGLTAGSGDSI